MAISTNKSTSAAESNLSTVLPSAHTDAIDMPVDPNEPTYCLCSQVSYGEMIGCDNPDVIFFILHIYMFII